MSVSSQIVAVPYSYVEVGVPMAFAGRVLSAQHIQVYYGSSLTSLAVYNTDYTVTVAADGQSATVDPLSPLVTKAAGGGVLVKRKTPMQQTFSPPKSGRISEKALEAALDASVLMAQELAYDRDVLSAKIAAIVSLSTGASMARQDVPIIAGVATIDASLGTSVRIACSTSDTDVTMAVSNPPATGELFMFVTFIQSSVGGHRLLIPTGLGSGQRWRADGPISGGWQPQVNILPNAWACGSLIVPATEPPRWLPGLPNWAEVI